MLLCNSKAINRHFIQNQISNMVETLLYCYRIKKINKKVPKMLNGWQSAVMVFIFVKAMQSWQYFEGY